MKFKPRGFVRGQRIADLYDTEAHAVCRLYNGSCQEHACNLQCWEAKESKDHWTAEATSGMELRARETGPFRVRWHTNKHGEIAKVGWHTRSWIHQPLAPRLRCLSSTHFPFRSTETLDIHYSSQQLHLGRLLHTVGCQSNQIPGIVLKNRRTLS